MIKVCDVILSPLDLLGIAAGSLSLVALLPQVVKSWKSKSTKDISLLAVSLAYSGSLLWFIYGILQHDKALVISNAAGLTFGSCLIVLKILYGR